MPQVIRKLQDNFGNKTIRLLFWVYTLILFAATLLPMNVISSGGEGWFSKIQIENGDKAIHFALFFIFTFLGFAAQVFYRNQRIWLYPFLFGLMIEILQHFIGWGRSFDIWDLVANSLGAFSAYFLIRKLFPAEFQNLNL